MKFYHQLAALHRQQCQPWFLLGWVTIKEVHGCYIKANHHLLSKPYSFHH